MTNREATVIFNVVKAIHHYEDLTIEECQFLLRFSIVEVDDELVPDYEGKLIAQMPQQEFNKLHRIANLGWERGFKAPIPIVVSAVESQREVLIKALESYHCENGEGVIVQSLLKQIGVQYDTE